MRVRKQEKGILKEAILKCIGTEASVYLDWLLVSSSLGYLLANALEQGY